MAAKTLGRGAWIVMVRWMVMDSFWLACARNWGQGAVRERGGKEKRR